ncbi:MFS transporter [Flexivirga sp. B27]
MTARTVAAPAAEHAKLPAAYIWWTVASATSLAGSVAFGFAVTWYATGISAGLTGLVGVLITLPTASLLLVGGAVADRVGVRRMLLIGDASMLVLALAVVSIANTAGVHAWLLILVAIVTGVEEAFYLPASGVVPRLFATGDALPRATALNSTLSQLARIAGPPCGALAVAAIAFGGVAAVDAATFAVVLVVLPAVIYGPSLLARQSGWGPGASGLMEVGWLIGGIVVTAVVARRGVTDRPGPAVGVGLGMVTVGLLGMALGTTPVVGFAAAVFMGVGVSVATAHLFPAYLAASPMDQLGRYQSMLVFVQMATLLVATVIFTTVAGAADTRWALGLCALGMGGTLLWWTWRANDRA